jgi:hypothetical protein
MPSLHSQFKFRASGVTAVSGTIQRDFAIINKNLNIELRRIKKRTTKGLLLAVIEIRRSMDLQAPLIPVDFGNLRASFFIVTKNTVEADLKSYEVTTAKFRKVSPTTGERLSSEKLAKLNTEHKQGIEEARGEVNQFPDQPVVMLGFSAFYAAPVHEMVGENINWNRFRSGPKFFQAAVYNNFDTIVKTVYLNTRIRV